MKETSEDFHILVELQAQTLLNNFTKKRIPSVLHVLIYMAVIPGRSLTTDAEKMFPELFSVFAFWLST